MADRDLLIRIRTDIQGALRDFDRLERRLQQLSQRRADLGGVRGLSGSLDHAGVSATNLALKLGAVYAAYKLLGTVQDFFARGMEGNANLENIQLGIASLITAQSQLKTASGDTLGGAEALGAAYGMAAEQADKLRVNGLQTAATFKELSVAFEQAVGAGLANGLNLDQIRQFTVGVTQAAGALGVPMFQLNQEVRSILDGTIDMNSRVAKALGITNAMVANWKEQGVLAERLNDRLKAFNVAGEELALTWKGATSNAEEMLDIIAMMATRGYFDKIKAALLDATRGGFDLDTAKPEEKLQGFIDLLKTGFDQFGDEFAGIITDLAAGIESLSKWWVENQDAAAPVQELIHQMFATLAEILRIVPGIVSAFTGAATEGQRFSSVAEDLAFGFAHLQRAIQFISLTLRDAAGFAGALVKTLTTADFSSWSAFFNQRDQRVADFEQNNPVTRVEQGLQQRRETETASRGINYLLDQAAAKYRLPAGFIQAIAQNETGGVRGDRNAATSSAGAMGIMQLMPATAAGLGVRNPRNPAENIEGGAKYLRQMLDMFKGNVAYAAAAYNAGPGNVQKAIKRAQQNGTSFLDELPRPQETKPYVLKLMKALGTSAQDVKLVPNPTEPSDKQQRIQSNIDKARLSAQQQQIELRYQLTQDGLKREQEALKRALDAETISQTDYYNQLRELKLKDIDAQASAEQEKLKLARQALADAAKLTDTDKKESATLAAKGQIAAIEQRLTILGRERKSVEEETAASIGKVNAKNAEDLQKLLGQYDQMDETLLKIQEDVKRAIELGATDQQVNLIIKSNLDSELQKLMSGYDQFAAIIERTRADASRAFQLGATDDQIKKIIDAGIPAELNKIVEAYDQVGAAIRKVQEDARNAFDLGATDEQMRKIVEAGSKQVEDMRKGLDEQSNFAEQAARNMQSAFADFLFDPFKDGVEGMVINFGTAMRRIIAEWASQKILNFLVGEDGKGLDKGFSVLGGLLGLGGGKADQPPNGTTYAPPGQAGQPDLSQVGAVTSEFASKLSSELSTSLSGIFSQISDSFTSIFSGIGSLFSSLGGFLGFDTGGYTGAGNRLDVAGIVHRDEYVFSKPAVQRLGVGFLDALHTTAKAGQNIPSLPEEYANGGLVTALSTATAVSGPTRANAGSRTASPISVTNHFTISGPANRQTESQIAAASAMAIERARRRNT